MAIDFVEWTVPQMVKVIFSLPGIRRAPGAKGILASFTVLQEEVQSCLLDFVRNGTDCTFSLLD